MATIVINNAAIVPFGDDAVVASGAVAFNAAGVLELGTSEQILATYKGSDVFDGGGRLVTPGLINLHSHLYSTLARGLTPPGLPPTSFPEVLSDFWWRWDKCLDLPGVRLSAQLGLLEALSCGVTTVFDHHSSPNAVTGSLATMAQAYQDTGCRGSLCYEVSDRDGPGVTQEGVEENLHFANKVGTNWNGKLGAHFGLHANFTLSENTLRDVSEKLSGRDLGVHIHMAEDDSDNLTARTLGYSGPAERLHDFGLLNQRSLLIHGVHLELDQWDLVRQAGAHIVHNPASNLNNAVGMAPVSEMLAKGLSVGLGTDGYHPQMLTSMNLAQLVARHKTSDSRRGEWAATLLMKSNPGIASLMLDRTLGALTPGAAADIVLWDYQPVTPLDGSSAEAHLMFGLQYSRPVRIWVDGEVIWEQGHSVGVDEDRLMQEAREAVPELWRKFRA
jgi:putative selenium metabolism protein SsnA